MRSTASFRGHPIHPMLIPFPIGFLSGGLVADVAGAVTGNLDFAITAYYMIAAGIVAGVLAALPGLIDFFRTVPPESTARRRATRHLAANAAALLIFAGAWILRGGPGIQPEPVIIAFEAVGAVLLTIGGWIGGTLTFRNQIGVDHRYAGAGKWSEAAIRTGGPGPFTVALVDELDVNQMKLIRVNGERLVLAHTEEGWTAFTDRCPHRGGSLADGIVACGTVTFPWHGSQFDIVSGNVVSGPASDPIRSFPVEVVGDEIRIHHIER